VRSLSAESIQILMEELDRVSESPALAGALEHCNSVTAEQKAQLHELRGTAIDHGALAEAALEAEPDLGKRQTLLQRLATMTVAQRVQSPSKEAPNAPHAGSRLQQGCAARRAAISAFDRTGSGSLRGDDQL